MDATVKLAGVGNVGLTVGYNMINDAGLTTYTVYAQRLNGAGVGVGPRMQVYQDTGYYDSFKITSVASLNKAGLAAFNFSAQAMYDNADANGYVTFDKLFHGSSDTGSHLTSHADGSYAISYYPDTYYYDATYRVGTINYDATGHETSGNLEVGRTDVDGTPQGGVTFKSIALDHMSIAENSTADTLVGTVSSTYTDDTGANPAVTYSISGGDGAFKIDASSGALTVANPSKLDYEKAQSDTVLVRASTDTGSYIDQAYKIAITDVHETTYAGLDYAGTLNFAKFADDFYLSGSTGNDKLAGGSGNDHIFGDNHDDLLIGNAGDDYLYGGYGRDTMKGGSGNDHIYGEPSDGGHEGDTALYNGPLSRYIITNESDGIHITDRSGGQNSDGSDVVTGVDYFKFGATTYTLAEILHA